MAIKSFEYGRKTIKLFTSTNSAKSSNLLSRILPVETKRRTKQRTLQAAILQIGHEMASTAGSN